MTYFPRKVKVRGQSMVTVDNMGLVSMASHHIHVSVTEAGLDQSAMLVCQKFNLSLI